MQSITRLRISTKITILYAAILMVVLILSSVVTGLGVYFSFYHQAEVEIEIYEGEFILFHLLQKRQKYSKSFKAKTMLGILFLPAAICRG